MEPAKGVDNVPSRDSGFGIRVPRTPLVALAAVAIIALSLWILGELITVALLAFAGLLVALVPHTLATWLSRITPLSRGISLAVVLTLFAALIVAFVVAVAPVLANQLDQLLGRLPEALGHIRGELERYAWGSWLVDEASRWTSSISAPRIVSRATSLLSTTIGFLTSALIVAFIGLFVAAEPGLYRRGALKLVPLNARDRAAGILDATSHALRYWLLGRVVSMTIIGVVSWIGLVLLDVKLAFFLAVFAAVLTFIPYVGPLLSVLPAALLGLLTSPMTALYVLLLYLGIQLGESYLITPLIQRRAVSLPPALTLAVQVAMGIFAGALGIALAAPLTVVLLVVVQRAYVRDLLGDAEEKAIA